MRAARDVDDEIYDTDEQLDIRVSAYDEKPYWHVSPDWIEASPK